MSVWTQVVDDLFTTAAAPRNAFPVGPFAGANSTGTGPPTNFVSPSVGGDWIDHAGGMFEIVSSGLAGWGAGGITTIPANAFYRPSVENALYSRIDGSYPAATTTVALLLCFIPATNTAYVLQYSAVAGTVSVWRYVNNVLTNLIASISVPTIVPAAAFVVSFTCEVNLSGANTLTGQLYLASDTGRTSPYWTGASAVTVTDSSGSKLPAGAAGAGPPVSTASRWNRLTTFQGATGGAINPGTLSAVAGGIGKGSIQLAYPGTTGGILPYTTALFRSTVNGVKGSQIATNPAFPYTDSAGLTKNTTYYYTLEITDSTPQTADTAQLAVTTANRMIGCIGDSNMADFGNNGSVPQSMPNVLVGILGGRGYDLGFVNSAVTGSMTWDWVSGQANLIAAKAAFAGFGSGDYIFYCLGTNDSKTTAHSGAPTTDAAYITNAESTCNDLLLAFPGVRILLLHPFWVSPTASGFDINSPAHTLTYGATDLPAVVAAIGVGTNVRHIDPLTWNSVQQLSLKILNTDGIHLNVPGQQIWATNIASAFPDWPDGTPIVEGGGGGSYGYCG